MDSERKRKGVKTKRFRSRGPGVHLAQDVTPQLFGAGSVDVVTHTRKRSTVHHGSRPSLPYISIVNSVLVLMLFVWMLIHTFATPTVITSSNNADNINAKESSAVRLHM